MKTPKVVRRKTPELVARAQAMRDQGMMFSEIGAALGMSQQAIHGWLRPPRVRDHSGYKDTGAGMVALNRRGVR